MTKTKFYAPKPRLTSGNRPRYTTQVAKDRRYYKPFRRTPLNRREFIKAAYQNLQVPHIAANWTDLDDWTDAQQDIEDHVQGSPTYYKTSNPQPPETNNQYQDQIPVVLASIIKQKDPRKEYNRNRFRAKFARAERLELERQERLNRRAERHAAYLKQSEASRKEAEKTKFQERFARRAERRPPGRPPGRPQQPPDPYDPELVEMAKMFARRREATIKRREKIKKTRGRRKKVKKDWLQQWREDRQNPA